MPFNKSLAALGTRHEFLGVGYGVGSRTSSPPISGDGAKSIDASLTPLQPGWSPGRLEANEVDPRHCYDSDAASVNRYQDRRLDTSTRWADCYDAARRLGVGEP